MKAIEIAELKDNILDYLSKSPRQHLSAAVIYNELNLKNIPMAVFRELLKEMETEGMVNIAKMTGDRFVIVLQDAGRRLIFDGGYTEKDKKELMDMPERKNHKPPPNVKRVLFISYATENANKVKLIEKEIKNHSLFESLVVANKREPNKALVKKVTEGIDSSYRFIPILTRHSIQTQWINQEIGYAVGKNIPIIPVVEKGILNDLKGFVHKQNDCPYIYQTKADFAMREENKSFMTQFRLLIKDLEEELKENKNGIIKEANKSYKTPQIWHF
jgi:hypothetical protein